MGSTDTHFAGLGLIFKFTRKYKSGGRPFFLMFLIFFGRIVIFKHFYRFLALYNMKNAKMCSIIPTFYNRLYTSQVKSSSYAATLGIFASHLDIFMLLLIIRDNNIIQSRVAEKHIPASI